MDDSGALDLHQTEGITITIITAIFAHLTAGRSSESGTTRSGDRSHSFTWGVIGRLRGHVGRTPRSRSDRTAIAARSSRHRGAFAAESTPQGPDVIFVRMCSEIDAQSTHDQATIVVDPGEKRVPGGNGIHGEIKANSWPISKRQRRPKESLPLPIKPPPRSSSIGHDLRGNFFFKKPMYFFFCFLTFDRLVKKLSEFRERSLVHRVPPAFRLDCEAIGAGLITNFSLISSNFPLEFRTSTRKNPSKIWFQSTRIGAPSLRQSG